MEGVRNEEDDLRSRRRRRGDPGCGEGIAADKLTLQLKWVTQAQFAGYYVAKDKGFYKDEGLDVTIKPGRPDIAPNRFSSAEAPTSS